MQLPVHSPLTWRGLGAGLQAVLGSPSPSFKRVRETLLTVYGSRAVHLTDSGTTALRLALHGAPPPVAALPAYGCYDIATAMDGAGGEFLLYDLDPATLGPDLGSLERTLEAGARRIVVAHLYGVPVDLRAVQAIADRYDALIVEDAAQGAGGRFEGKPLGAWGAYGILSFGRGKGVTAGRGGALLANTEEAAARSTELAAHLRPAHTRMGEVGAAVAQWLMARPMLYGLPASLPFLGLGETRYRPVDVPGSLSAFAAGVLAEAFRSGVASEEAARRRHNAARLLLVAARASQVQQVRPPFGSEPGYLRLPLRLGQSRSEVDWRAARRLGIMPGYPRALADLAAFGERRRNRDTGFPAARLLAETLVTLPTHSRLNAADLAALEGWLRFPTGQPDGSGTVVTIRGG